MRESCRVLIGSIGDDIHSVGMCLLTIAFREAGFLVRNLMIGNQLDDFFHAAKDFDAVFISCMNGHADLYLEDFPQLLREFRLANKDPKVWYLGGNLSVNGEGEAIVRKYRSMGFDYVAPKPVGWEFIMKNLLADMQGKGIKKRLINLEKKNDDPPIPGLELVDDAPLTDEAFHAIREEVLAGWPTGSAVWDTDVKANHKYPNKNLHAVTVERLNSSSYRPLLQPRTGVALVSDEIAILKLLRENGLDISSIQLDAACRKGMYGKAQEGVRRSENDKKSFLNGFPIPVHGVRGVEEILSAIDTPFQIRAGSPDHRLTYEIGLAGGTTSVEGGFICYLFPYDKNTSPVTNLNYWKYVDKLAGWYYQQHGIIVNREYFGPLTTSLIEPTIPICINIIEAILSAKSGVISLSLGLAEQGNRSQDIAAIHVLDKVTRKYLAKYGYPDCSVSTVYHQYMAAFPTDEKLARDLIVNSSSTGALAGATRFLIKSPVESFKIPSKQDNAAALRLTQAGVAWAKDMKPDWQMVQSEMAILERQVCSIMREIEEFGQGSLARGAIIAFQKGYLDIPFSPSVHNRNNLLTARDCGGAIRFINPDLLPFEDELIDFHKEKISERMMKERQTKIHEIIDSDLTRIWKNEFREWPLDSCYIR